MISERERRQWGFDDSEVRRDAWATLLLEIDSRISLQKTQYDGLKGRYETVGDVLDTAKDPELDDLILIPQGSFSTLTVTRPPGRKEVDVDAIAYLKRGTTLQPVELLDHFLEELDDRVRTGGSVKTSNRCITIRYADKSLPCHMDVTPALARKGNPNRDGSGRLVVPDCREESWSPSNPVDYAGWFNELAERELTFMLPRNYVVLLEKRAEVQPLPSFQEVSAPNLLRVITRLCKRNRDIYVTRTGREKTQPISILITTLIGKSFNLFWQRTRARNLSVYDVLEAVILDIPNQFDPARANEQYWLENPKDSTENFAEKWNRDPHYQETFLGWHKQLCFAFELGFEHCPTRDRFRSELIKSYGQSGGLACDDFFEAVRSQAHPGLSKSAANVARISGQSAIVLGLNDREPTRAADPKPIDRLG